MKDFLKNLLPKRFRKDNTIIPVVRLSGAIMAGGNALRPALNLAGVATVLDKAFSMKKAPAVAILIFAWSLKGMGDALGIGVFVENLVGTNASASVILPAVMFMIAIFLAFSTGTSWGTFAILVPIVVAMFPGQKNLEMMIISVAAVLAGAVCGDRALCAEPLHGGRARNRHAGAYHGRAGVLP